jgi:hypothetical protein
VGGVVTSCLSWTEAKGRFAQRIIKRCAMGLAAHIETARGLWFHEA